MVNIHERAQQMHKLGMFIIRTPANVDKVNFEIEKKNENLYNIIFWHTMKFYRS